MSFVSPFLAAAAPVIAQAVAATAAPAGALKKALAPVSSATLSPQNQAALAQSLSSFQFAHKSPMALNYPWLTHTFAALFVFCAVGLVALLAVQTTKQEGLSGTIGGRVEAAYRPRLGFDQQLQRLTSVVAIGMVFFGVVLSLTGI